jgi:hypothetical protein
VKCNKNLLGKSLLKERPFGRPQSEENIKLNLRKISSGDRR